MEKKAKKIKRTHFKVVGVNPPMQIWTFSTFWTITTHPILTSSWWWSL